MFNTNSIIFNTEFIIFNAKFIIFNFKNLWRPAFITKTPNGRAELCLFERILLSEYC